MLVSLKNRSIKLHESTVSVPCSKSILNRVLILNKLTQSSIKVDTNDLCDDTKYMIEGIKKLHSSAKTVKILTGNAGTTTRFLTALCSQLENKKTIHITGDTRMNERPIKELVQALTALGAQINCPTGCTPLIITPSQLQGGTIHLPGNISSQYLSALLMVSPFAKNQTIINIDQELCSKPYVELTLAVMKDFGLTVLNKNFKQFIVPPNQTGKKLKNYTIESDASSASYPAAFAMINSEKEITLENINPNSLQGDIEFLNYLKKMGAKISIQTNSNDKTSITIQGPQKLKSLGKINMNATPDLVMTFAVLAMFTPGKTLIYDITNLRIKETDRLKALQNEIKKFGIKVKAGKDFIEIIGQPSLLQNKLITQKRIQIKTYNDHRMAMCFAILKNHFPYLEIENPECVSKSYTTFWADLKKIMPNNIVLTGLRGSGKSTIGCLLAKTLKKTFIDTDKEIELKAKMKIKDIVEKKGWPHFRKLEKEIIAAATKLQNCVTATGGGALLSAQNIKALKENSQIIYLQTTPARAAARIAHDPNRPPLTTQKSLTKELAQLLKERKALYENNAYLIFKRTNSPANDSKRILKLLA